MSRLSDQISQLGRYAEMQYILLGDLREVLESRPGLAERNWMLTILDALLDTLPTHFSLKEEGGYKPLVKTLDELRTRVAEGSQYKQVAQVVCDDLDSWMKRLQQHERTECQLFQDSVNLEVGVGD